MNCKATIDLHDLVILFLFFVPTPANAFVLKKVQKNLKCNYVVANGTRLCEVRIFEIRLPGCDDDLKTDY